jgi:RNA polymerase sigma-32 factor
MQNARPTCKVPYLEELRRFPMLSPDEEYTLAVRWRERGDRSAVHQLLTSHLRLVAKIAMGYRRSGLPTSDLISEGNVGLIHAAERFDPQRGNRFSTYATWWIKAAIQDYVLRSWSLVKIGTTADQKKLFFNLAKAKRRLSALQEGELLPDHVTIIAKELGVTEQDVVEMNRRLSGDISLNQPVSEEDNSVEWQDRMVEEGSDQEALLAESQELEARRNALHVAVKVLKDRERHIFEARRLADPPCTLDELAAKFFVSRERIRRIENRALQKVERAAHRIGADKLHSSANRCVSPRDGASNTPPDAIGRPERRTVFCHALEAQTTMRLSCYGKRRLG